MRRILLLLLILCLAAAPALADSYLVPGLTLSDLEGQPFRLQLTPVANVVMPLDESRTAELNGLLRHLRLEAEAESTGEDDGWERLSISVDGREALGLTQHRTAGGTSLSLSACQGQVFASSGDALSLLLGTQTNADSLYGMELRHLALPAEADALLAAVLSECAGEMTVTRAHENVKGFGKATQRIRWTISAGDAAAFGAQLTQLCPDGALKSFLAGLTFSGKLSFNMLADEEGEVLKLTWSGQCGPDADSLRKVTITWRRQRDDAEIQDELTIKSPAVKGKNRDTVTFERRGTVKEQVRELTASLSWEKRRDGEQTRTLTASLDASSTQAGSQYLLSGGLKATLKTGSDDTEGQEAEWSLSYTPPLAFSGSLTLREKRDGHTTSDITLTGSGETVSLGSWEQTGERLSLDTLDEASLAARRQEILTATAEGLIRPLVLLPEEDTIYLSRELPEWQQIVDAARQNAGAAKEDN